MRSGVRVTGLILLGALVAGLVTRLVTRVRFGRSGSDTIPLDRRSEAGNRGSTTHGSGSQPNGRAPVNAPARVAGTQVAGTHTAGPTHAASAAYEEETEVAVKEPSITASPNRGLALTVGAVLFVWGILGFFFAADGDPGFFSRQGGMLWNAFGVNPPLALIWVMLAAVLLITGLGTTIGSRNGNTLVGVVLVVLALYGFVFGNTSANIFALNTTDNVFHAIVGVILLLTAFGADKENIRALRAEHARV
ncbi:protein of unknown function [Curtobacterium sp. UNCCL20]|nr:protein of unknown function [Curtobacterium sp. UNCCL20]